ncbi:deoxyribodipyrimidine photolyase [Candidatus Bathyarchaeota archaeon]|nr:deoxyribodipyrimidine photolyase [Candidatus Bathyarchaeota archaeon]
MQSAQRVSNNPALEYSIDIANKKNKPLLVVFCLTNYPEANLRHYYFMIEGLKETFNTLQELGIQTSIQIDKPINSINKLSDKAVLTVIDQGYTKEVREWYDRLSKKVKCPVIQIETNIVIPVETASQKEEYAAYTIRKKINNNKDKFLHISKADEIGCTQEIGIETIDLRDIKNILNKLKIDNSVKKSKKYTGGYRIASKLLDEFIDDKLDIYAEERNDPTNDALSELSPYLHFGQISPVEVAVKVIESGKNSIEEYLEQLIVRRELAINFVYYNEKYYSFECLPDWCKDSLLEHEKDKREHIYTYEDLERADTHDPYWNAAQKQMTVVGKMHGYMRMYWGKKILEWIEDPRVAFDIALKLNNKYEIDGRDPNGYAGIAWCFGKHDRPWKERPIFGKIRYMNSNGLKRKFDTELYLKQRKSLQE